jgi:hypothetical protein
LQIQAGQDEKLRKKRELELFLKEMEEKRDSEGNFLLPKIDNAKMERLTQKEINRERAKQFLESEKHPLIEKSEESIKEGNKKLNQKTKKMKKSGMNMKERLKEKEQINTNTNNNQNKIHDEKPTPDNEGELDVFLPEFEEFEMFSKNIVTQLENRFIYNFLMWF